MTTRAILVADNLRLLEQGIDLLGELDDALFARPEPAVSSSGIGAHVRHCADHYASFLSGLEARRVDYDERERDTRLETCREAAMQRLEQLASELRHVAQLPQQRERLTISMDSNGSGADGRHCSDSTVERELQFLLSHTVHHYALIGVILRLAGRTPPPELGVAPSTLSYWRRLRESGAREEREPEVERPCAQ